MKSCSKEAKESQNESRSVRQKGVRSKSRATKFSQREALMSRANSLKKAVRQIIEHAERALDEQNSIHPSGTFGETASRQSPPTGPGGRGSDIKLIVTHPDDSEDSNLREQKPVGSSLLAAGRQQKAAASMPMALLQLYSAIGSGDSSSEPSPCPSPIPVVPSLTTNFPLLPTSPIRYPHPLQPVFYRMATPPNVGPQRGVRATSPRHQESTTESEGDEDREAMLSLQVIDLSYNYIN